MKGQIMEKVPDANSRQFFRINDTIILQYNPIGQEEVAKAGAIINQPSHNKENKENSQLQALQTTFTSLVDQINHQDREVARALRLLDEKIDIFSHMLAQQQSNNSDNRNSIEVNLSAGGIAFLTPDKLDLRTPVEIYIELPPAGTKIHALANVISCDNTHEESLKPLYLLRFAFTHMSETDRNLLVKQTLSRQAENLRSSID